MFDEFVRKKISLKSPLLNAGIIGIAFFSIIIFFLNFTLSIQNSYAQLPSPIKTDTSQNLTGSIAIKSTSLPKPTSPGLPIRLKIPKIKVDAAIEYVGLTPKKEMGIPKLPRNTAWFNLGTRPGEIGSAAIAGHVDWWNGTKAVFANLNKLKIGDKITVQDEHGTVVNFVVHKIKSYNSKEAAPEVFYSNDGKSHLNLITCFGVWDKKAKQYSQRLVVFAEKE